jgi:hypothetical protein
VNWNFLKIRWKTGRDKDGRDPVSTKYVVWKGIHPWSLGSMKIEIPVGIHEIRATYGGDGTHSGATSEPVVQTVN